MFSNLMNITFVTISLGTSVGYLYNIRKEENRNYNKWYDYIISIIVGSLSYIFMQGLLIILIIMMIFPWQ